MIMRTILALFVILALGFLFLQSKGIDRSFELPIFLRQDSIAASHQTDICITVKSCIHPSQTQLADLARDYSALWAHLNHLYRTNDVRAGKEYYTEDWYRLICRHNPPATVIPVVREDVSHDLKIMHWSTDGLVCTVVDSNVLLRYTYTLISGKDSIAQTGANIAVALLYQGDHWRIDAWRHLDEELSTRMAAKNLHSITLNQ